MGGRAVAEFGEVKRLTSSQVDDLADEIIGKITSVVKLNNPLIRVVPSYRTKETHGDIDILISRGVFDQISQGNPEIVIPLLGSVGMFTCANSDSYSYAIPLDGGGIAQVDLLVVDSNLFEFAHGYYSYNDLGNFIGYVAKSIGLTFGHAGLRLDLRSWKRPTEVIARPVITTDFKSALEFLGYSHDRWLQGFDTIEDCFEFALSSPFASPEVFAPSAKNSEGRRRDAKRKSYIAFKEYLNTRYGLTDEAPPFVKSGEVIGSHILRAYDVFPSFYYSVDRCLSLEQEKEAFRDVFNGELVSELTGFTGKDLSLFMSKFRKLYSNQEMIAMGVDAVSLAIQDFNMRHYVA